MFKGCTKLANLEISNFDTAIALNMIEMFSGDTSLRTLNLTKFDTHNIDVIDKMFDGCKDLIIYLDKSRNEKIVKNLPDGVEAIDINDKNDTFYYDLI